MGEFPEMRLNNVKKFQGLQMEYGDTFRDELLRLLRESLQLRLLLLSIVDLNLILQQVVRSLSLKS